MPKYTEGGDRFLGFSTLFHDRAAYPYSTILCHNHAKAPTINDLPELYECLEHNKSILANFKDFILIPGWELPNDLVASMKAQLIEAIDEDSKNIEHLEANKKIGDAFQIQIDTILSSFATKINTIGEHYPEAKQKAQNLLNNLEKYKKDALINFASEELAVFKNKAELDINAATPLLQKDLGWGDCLSNLASQIMNTVTTFIAKIVTLGYSKHQGLFNIKQSDAWKAANELNWSIRGLR
jgi:hypothetical protein